jgi:peptide/nickel transport system ATP-binding protein
MVGIPDPERRLKAFPHEMSGGMAQRVMIAMALACEPELLIADEPTTALDVTVQAQILGLLTSMVREKGLSMLLITHDLGIVSTIADRVVVLYAGKVVEDGPTMQIIGKPTHPYTEALMRSSLLIPNDEGKLYAIPGGAPRPGEELVGCRFRARCHYADALGIAAKCEATEPGLHLCESGHQCRCWAVQDGLIQLTPADPIRQMVVEQATATEEVV